MSAAQALGGGEFVLLDTIEVLRARGMTVRVLNLSDPATRSRLGQAGRHRAERLFGLAGYGEQIHAVVDGVVERGR